jgi:hypothetical protein
VLCPKTLYIKPSTKIRTYPAEADLGVAELTYQELMLDPEEADELEPELNERAG